MSHFAEIDENDMVIDVVVVGDEYLLDADGVEREELGVAFCKIFSAVTGYRQATPARSESAMPVLA